MIVSAENESDHTEFKGASSQNYENLDSGINKNVKWDGVGSVDRMNLTKEGYSELGGRDGGIRQTTLSLDQKSSYFGFDLGSGSKGGQVDFYNGNSRVGSLSIADLGVDSGFIHFTGDVNTSWDTVVFSSGENGIFDTKNWTSRVEGWNPEVDGALPGKPQLEITNGSSSVIDKVSSSFAVAAPGAPAPPMTACLAFAGVLLLQALRRAKSVA